MAGERILIVEDDAIIADTLRGMLLDGGYGEPVVVASGEAGIEAVDSQSVSLVLMDIRLAGKLDGIATAERIRSCSDLPIVYLTAYDEDSLLARAKLSVPYGYLVKPVSGRELKATVEMALHRHAVDKSLAESERALRESEEESRALLELGGRSGEAIVMLRDDHRGVGMCVYANEPLCEMTGYTQEEILSLSFFDLVHPRDREEALEHHRQRIAGSVMLGFSETTLVRRDGREVPVESTFAYSFYRGQPVDVGYIRDIAGRRMVEEHIIVTERLAAMGAMAAGVVQQIDVAVGSVIEAAERLSNRLDLVPEVMHLSHAIRDDANTVGDAVHRLALFAQDHGKGAVRIDVNETIESVLQLRPQSPGLDGIRVRKTLASDLPFVVANGFQMRQVFLNIVTNSEYFMLQANQGGLLTITTERQGDVVRVQFVDNGPGMAAGNLEGLLGPSLVSSSPVRSAGFGLDVCRRIVGESGGVVSVLNETGKGTTYVVDLPCAADSE